jgi:hypothetical protein
MGSVAARPMGGRQPFALAAKRKQLPEWIAQQPNLPPWALQAELHARGITVSYCTVWNSIGAVTRLGDPSIGSGSFRSQPQPQYFLAISVTTDNHDGGQRRMAVPSHEGP